MGRNETRKDAFMLISATLGEIKPDEWNKDCSKIQKIIHDAVECNRI